MQEITPKEQNRLLTLMRRHKKRLTAYPNVRAVDIGFEFKRKRPSGRLAIRVHVSRKLPNSRLADAERLPDEIDGIPVDVIESNPVLDPDFRNSRQDPVLGGINIGNSKVGQSGTLAIVFETETMRPLALSCWHVLVADLSVGMDPILQPALTPAPGTVLPDNFFLGRLLRWDKDLDVAVCSIGEQPLGDHVARGRNISLAITELSALAAGSRSPVAGLKVIKSGLGTGVTRGIIDGTDGVQFSVVVDSEFPPQGRLAGHGDSGALWLDRQTFSAVGVHFQSDPDAPPGQDRAFGNSMQKVGEKLNIFVLDTAAISTAFIGGSCSVLARTRPLAQCSLKVVYPSRRVSQAKGLGPKQADAQGIVNWSWAVGSSTARKPGIPVNAFVTLDGVERVLTTGLDGHTDTTH